MARTTRRTSLSTLVPKTAIEKATFTLQDLPEKPKEELSLKEAVQNMREVISAALSKGYSLEEVAEMLTQQGVDITPPSLKYYLTRGIKAEATTTRTKGRRGGRPKKAEAEASAPAATPVEPEPVVEEAKPKTTRRPRATTSRTAAKQTTRPSTRAKAAKEATESPAKKTPGRRRKSEA